MTDTLPPEVERYLLEATSNTVITRLEAVDYLEAHITAQAEEIERLREELRQAGCVEWDRHDCKVIIMDEYHREQRDRYKAMAEWLAVRLEDHASFSTADEWLEAAEEAISQNQGLDT